MNNTYEDNNDLNDLNELKDYLINNYNLDSKINITDGYNKNNIKNVYFKIFFYLVYYFYYL